MVGAFGLYQSSRFLASNQFHILQVILRFQVVNPTFDKFTDIRDCALMGDDFVVIDKRNEWIKSFDVTNGRYIGTNNKGFTSAPVGVHSLTHLTMLLVEQTEEGFCELYFVNKVPSQHLSTSPLAVFKALISSEKLSF